MENEQAITPQQITNLNKVPPEEIAKLSEDVMDATRVMSNANEELDHLSNCLADLAQTHDEYCKKTKHVKNQMRYLGSHL